MMDEDVREAIVNLGEELNQAKQRDFAYFVKLKKFQAGRITEIISIDEAGVTDLLFEREGKRIAVTHEWMVLNQPEVGGYFLLFADGSSRYIAEKEFEDNHVRM